MKTGLVISSTHSENPYREVILNFLSQQFPATVRTPDGKLDALTGAFIATSHIRFGPNPSPENLVAIRKVISSAVETWKPIPVLMPWGSRKPDNGTVDVAEIGALKMLEALQLRVQSFYPPGITIRLRVEDVAGQYLWKDDGSEAIQGSRLYTKEIKRLVDVLAFNSFIDLVYESEIIDAERFRLEADSFRPLFLDYLIDTDAYGIDADVKSRYALNSIGWSGDISMEQREFYRRRYAKSYPGVTAREQTEKLAGYFSGVMARKVLAGYGSEKCGDNFINLTFAPPVPGLPLGQVDRRIYYRTLPDTMAKTHIPPWRARGFLKIEGREIKMKLDNFDPALELIECSVDFGDGEQTVNVRTPHLVAS